MPGTQAHRNTPTTTGPILHAYDMLTCRRRAHPGDRKITLLPSANYSQGQSYQENWLCTLFPRLPCTYGYINIISLSLQREAHWLLLLNRASQGAGKCYKRKWCILAPSKCLIVLSTFMLWLFLKLLSFSLAFHHQVHLSRQYTETEQKTHLW